MKIPVFFILIYKWTESQPRVYSEWDKAILKFIWRNKYRWEVKTLCRRLWMAPPFEITKSHHLLTLKPLSLLLVIQLSQMFLDLEISSLSLSSPFSSLLPSLPPQLTIDSDAIISSWVIWKPRRRASSSPVLAHHLRKSHSPWWLGHLFLVMLLRRTSWSDSKAHHLSRSIGH